MVGLLPAIAVAIGVSLVASFSASAQPICDVSWAGPVSGNWNDATKWDTGAVPGSTHNVCIEAVGAPYTVTLNISDTIAGFSLDSPDATFSATGRTLTVNGPATLTTGDVVWTSSGWAGSWTLTNNTNMTFRGGGSSISSNFVQDGNLVIQATNTVGDASVTASSGLTNRGRIVLESVGNAQPANLIVSSGTLVNVETGDIEVRAGSGGSRTITAQVVNRGVMELGASTTVGRTGANHTNSGAIRINNASVTFTGNMLTNQTGGTILGVGTLNVLGVSFANNGQVSPGLSPGVLNLSGNYTQGLGGALDIEVGGLIPGTGFDQLNVSGIANLDGALNVSLVPGFIPISGDSFRVLTFGSGVGQFAVINDTEPGDGVTFEAILDASGLTLRASVVDVPVVVPGDVNGDGRVDAADLRIVMERFNTGDTDADVNRDGQVDILDLASVAADFGKVDR